MRTPLRLWKRLSGLALSALSPLALAAPAQAAVPTTLAVDGALTSVAGGPVPDGKYVLSFAMYKDAAGGTAVWSEGPVALTLKGGRFSYQAGAKTPLNAAALASLSTAYLGVQIDEEPELPRQALSSVAFALRAQVAEDVDCSGCIGTAQLDPKALADYAKTASLAKVATSGKFEDLSGGPDLSAYAKLANLAKVATSGAYADLAGAPDLAAYAKSADLGGYAKTGDLAAYAKTADLGGYAKTGDLAAYAKTADLGGYAKTGDLAAYAKTASLAKVASTGAYGDLSGTPDLSGYAKAGDLAAYAKATDLAAYAKAGDLAPYAKKADLANVATTGAYGDLSGTPDLSGYVKAGALANVATSGNFKDLNGVPTGLQPGAACGTGLVVKGFKADGALDCVPAGGKLLPGDLPPDGIDEVSNGLIHNQFNDSIAGTANAVIKDNNPTGTSDTIDFPDLGIAQKLTVSVDLVNSNISALSVIVFDPNNVQYVLCGGANNPACGTKGAALKATFPDPVKAASGDLTSWVGKNPKGKWYLTVIDTEFCTAPSGCVGNTSDGKVNAWSINLQTLSSKKIQVKGDAIVDNHLLVGGNVTVSGKILDQGVCGNRIVEPGETCDDGGNVDGDGCSALCQATGTEKDCATILAKNATAKSGWYTIDVDGSGATPARTVFCDMVTDGGGWTRFIYHVDYEGLTALRRDDWDRGIEQAAAGGIKQWLIKTYLLPSESSEAGSKFHNGWTYNLNAGVQGRGFTFFKHTTNLTTNAHRYTGTSYVDSMKLLAGSNCQSINGSYVNYLWGEHRWADNLSIGWQWHPICGSPASYHLLLVNHDYNHGATWGRVQTGIGTNQSPGGLWTTYDEDGGAYEFFYR